METEKIIEIENLMVEFKSRGAKRHRALDALTLTLARGESLSVVGESGSGKSTLLRSVVALIPAAGGKISLFGKELAAASRRELTALRRRCGYVPQDPYGAIPPGLSVIEAVMEPEIIAGTKRTKAERRARAEALLAEAGLSGERILASRAVGLSGGQRQRVELARALMLEPELLLCDEPTSMQDASTRGEIIEILRRRAEKGMSMLFVTHDLLLAARAAQKIIVLKDGRLCESGESKEVLNAPRHPYTKALLEALPRVSRL
ncbi:MAG: ABC transporter ATP-binding protein [Synergistaceae bacterium]|nr:ABC transporter ATP-binding protein [Synergistaceae bacterium]